jgi:hypothetical protein
MGQGGKTGERLKKVAVKAGNYTPVENEYDSRVAGIEYRCLLYFHQCCQMLPHCLVDIVVSQTGHPVEPYWLSLVEICSLTSYVNKR